MSEAYDLIVKNGRVIDGSGNPWFAADIGVRNGKIVRVGHLADAIAAQAIDGSGRVVTPGFIDIHNHSDTSLLMRPTVDSHIMQGVTTIVTGQCGCSAAPMSDDSVPMLTKWVVIDGHLVPELKRMGILWRTFAQYLEQVEKRGVSVNVAPLIGHGNLRTIALGWANRLPTGSELEKMCAFAAEAMESGAFGMSTGLIYAPGFFSDTHELIEVTKVVARHGGFYATHMRDEADAAKYRASVDEALEIGLQSGAPVQISHLETHYPNWGMQSEILQRLDRARARGIDVTCDVPPYVSGGTSVSAALPEWVQEGGYDKALERLRDPSIRRIVRDDRTSKRGTPGNLLLGGYWDKMWLRKSDRHPEYNGKSLAEIARMRGNEPAWDTLFDILVEEGGDLQVNGQWHDEQDIRTLVAHPLCMIETDASVVVSRSIAANPRAFGAFPLVFRKFVRGETRPEMPGESPDRVLTLQEAVRKMTSAPAQRLGLRDRGLVREGMWADLVVFDPEAIADRTTYVEPHQYPVGIDYVIVNGQVTVDHGKHLGTLAGKALRRAQ